MRADLSTSPSASPAALPPVPSSASRRPASHPRHGSARTNQSPRSATAPPPLVGHDPTERALSADPRHAPGVRRRVEFTKRLRQAVRATEALEESEEVAELRDDRCDYTRLLARAAMRRRQHERALRRDAAVRRGDLFVSKETDRREQRAANRKHMRQLAEGHASQQQHAAQRAEEARLDERKRLLERARFHEQRMKEHSDGVSAEDSERRQRLKGWREVNGSRLRSMHASEEEHHKQKLREHNQRRSDFRAKCEEQHLAVATQAEEQLRQKKVQLVKKRAELVTVAWEEDYKARSSIAQLWDHLSEKRLRPKELAAVRDAELRRRGMLLQGEAGARLQIQAQFRGGFALTWERMKRSRRDAGTVRQLIAAAAEDQLAARKCIDQQRQRKHRQQEREREKAARILMCISGVQELRQQRLAEVADARARARHQRREKQRMRRMRVVARCQRAAASPRRVGAPVDWASVVEENSVPSLV